MLQATRKREVWKKMWFALTGRGKCGQALESGITWWQPGLPAFVELGLGKLFLLSLGGSCFWKIPSTQGSVLALVLPLVVRFKHIWPSHQLWLQQMSQRLPTQPMCGHLPMKPAQARSFSLSRASCISDRLGLLLSLLEGWAVAFILKAGM